MRWDNKKTLWIKICAIISLIVFVFVFIGSATELFTNKIDWLWMGGLSGWIILWAVSGIIDIIDEPRYKAKMRFEKLKFLKEKVDTWLEHNRLEEKREVFIEYFLKQSEYFDIKK